MEAAAERYASHKVKENEKNQEGQRDEAGRNLQGAPPTEQHTEESAPAEEESAATAEEVRSAAEENTTEEAAPSSDTEAPRSEHIEGGVEEYPRYQELVLGTGCHEAGLLSPAELREEVACCALPHGGAPSP